MPTVPSAILMLSGTRPGREGVGEIVLADELSFLKPRQVSLFAALPRNASRISPHDCQLVDAQQMDRRFEQLSQNVARKLGGTAAYVANQLVYQRHVRKLTAAAIQFGQRQKSQLLWAVLDCPTTIFMARRVAQGLGIPLRALIWDSPDLFVQQLGWDQRSGRFLLQEFGQVLRSSEKIAVIGESMQAEFQRQYGVRGVILRHGVAEASSEPVPQRTNQAEWRIGFAGSMTAPDAFTHFVRCLDRQKWRIANKPVVLRLLGCRYHCDSTQPQHIEYLGRLETVSETVQALSECDLLYLPQSFAPALESLSRWSFPTKLSSYLPARRPIFLHAPPYASLVDFHRRYEFGICSTTLDESTVIADLTRMLTDDASNLFWCNEGRRCLEEELNLSLFRARFLEFLGVDL